MLAAGAPLSHMSLMRALKILLTIDLKTEESEFSTSISAIAIEDKDDYLEQKRPLFLTLITQIHL